VKKIKTVPPVSIHPHKETKAERHANALLKIGWLANKHKMGTPAYQQAWKDTLDVADLWVLVEKIGTIVNTALDEDTTLSS